MKTFIRVVELWVPDKTRTRLEFGGSLHSGEFTEFNAVSENALFAYDEGLPGKAWASGHPVILTEFANSYFKRTDEAREAGLTCGVALPVFAGEFLMAVMVLLCGDDRKHVGAIELWHNDPDRSHEMALVDGYYGTADMFEFNSRHTKFPRGFGLPGRTWKAGMPLIIKELHNAKGFLRGEEASEIGINCGVGIPYTTGDQTWVVTFLSAQATPIARRFEIWVPNEARSALLFDSGDCSEQSDLATLYAAKTIRRGEGSIGGVWATGMPALTEHLKQDQSIAAALARASGMNQVVALPVIENARLKAVLAWYL
ncbi:MULTISPECIES: GAF domain-containing protein [unclassified Bradyrhizobium]|uniref:GAF domain-containing protein n=1 Tax=unclassified Bradyrhizobium TaxID=2631580 RepID=UPI00048A4E83|nr:MULTISPECIES: GAF domain-containing protein [unclassified Bradyrhizobium]QIG93572.1 GAF domain-containing protein [Bradyrhizobium sp. 6(2017)]